MSHRMGDRELLELVAKAAGYEISGWHKNGYAITEEGGWNPATDNGNAFELAVKLNIDIGFDGDALLVQGRIHAYNVEDRCAATRRAIVRAAAEIGRREQQEAK